MNNSNNTINELDSSSSSHKVSTSLYKGKDVQYKDNDSVSFKSPNSSVDSVEIDLGNTKTKYINVLIRSLEEDEYEYGYISKTELLLQGFLRENPLLVKESLENILLENYSNKTIVEGLLRVISHFDYDILKPQGMMIVAACTPHSDSEIVECAIRCCENWENKESLEVLKNVTCSTTWLNDYLQTVIKNIEKGL